MPTEISLQKTEARTKLRALKKSKIILKRDVFFVPGWTDQACLCWTEPYTESGEDRLPDWEYTVKDWEYIVGNPEKIHYIQLTKNKNAITITRDNRGKIKKVEFKSDPSYKYICFFEFAELLKNKIRAEMRKKDIKEIDLIGHSMGGLDIISAVTLDPALDNYPEVKKFIKTKSLNNVGFVITAATPYKGSVPADISKYTGLDEMLRPKWSDGIRKQCDNMASDSEFIKIINQVGVRNRLLQTAKKGMHSFSGGDDSAVRPKDAFIEGAVNHRPFKLAAHSQKMGITQDPRLHLELFKLLGP